MNPASTSHLNDIILHVLRRLHEIRNFEGEPAAFWRMLLDVLLKLVNADAGIICLRTQDDSADWKTLTAGPETAEAAPIVRQLTERVNAAYQECAQSGYALMSDRNTYIAAVNLLVDVDIRKCIALFHLRHATDANEAMARINALLTVNDIPAQHRVQQSAFAALQNQTHLTDIIDILTLMNSRKRFVAASMTLVNELASRYKCDRVSLGWLQKGYVRVKAMSHTDQFEKKMEAIGQLELSMEESLDQEAEITFPPQETGGAVTRDHEKYARAQDVKFMTTLPLRKEGKVIALCSFERGSTPLTEAELRHIRVTLDQLTTRLAEIKYRDRWFGALWLDTLKEQAAKLVGHEHTWTKTLSIVGGALLVFVAFIPIRYRVDSPMILQTDDVSYITAPFDGYIDSVCVKPGDIAKDHGLLLSLDKKDLLIEEANLLAENNREQREVEKARAASELADMCIAQARLDQAAAKLNTVRYKLEQAMISSPFDGVVIEGDLKEKIGSPVKQGEVLFKIGKIKDIYAEAKVSEMEIQNVMNGAKGQIALASRPQEPFNVAVTMVEPTATVAAKDNIYVVRCKFTRNVPQWFRPGMTGISKINAGHNTLLWIVSHRTVDFLRLKLWW